MKTGVSTIRAVIFLGVIAFPASGRPSATLELAGASSTFSPVAGASYAEQRPSFFGYEEGEERRYVLGPPDALSGGEGGAWSIYLRELVGEPAEGIFELTHEWHRAETRAELPFGTITRIVSEGELRVNGHGFPVAVEFKTERHLAGMGDQIYTIRYRYEGGSYRKQISAEGKNLSHTAMIRGHKTLDRSVPSGLFALVPTAPDCSLAVPVGARRMARVVPPTRKSAGVTPPPIVQPTRFADNSSCRESLFANPGLVSLMLPELWEQGTGEREFLLMTPAGPFGMPGFVSGTGIVATVGPAAAASGSGFDFTRAASPDTNSAIERLRYIERVEVEVGMRTREAWLFDRMGDFEAIYVDDDGVVLKIDLSERSMFGLSGSEALVTVDPTQANRGRLSIRLLFPSEY